MKNFLFFVSVFIAALLAALMPACSLLPKYGDPESIEIEGETYVTGFYEDLWPAGIVFGEDDEPAFETKYHLWWEVEGATFDMYCAQNKDALWWNPAIYCRESMFDTVKDYYADTDNFDYYTGLYGDGNEAGRILLEGELDLSLLEEAVALNMKVEANEGKGLLTGKEDFSDIEVHIPVDEILPVQPVLYRVSKDGFFTTARNNWIVTDGEVYIAGVYDGEEPQTYTAYKTSDGSGRYIFELLVQTGILDI